jgi:hypothetical protein
LKKMVKVQKVTELRAFTVLSVTLCKDIFLDVS